LALGRRCVHFDLWRYRRDGQPQGKLQRPEVQGAQLQHRRRPNDQGHLAPGDPVTIAELLRGTIAEIAAGTVTGEVFPATVAVGDVIKLDKPYNVSDLVITDSAGSPVTLDPEHYDAFLEHGSIELLSCPAAPR
jgi:hypothetical protein